MVVEAVKDPLHETLHSRQSYNQLWVLEDGGKESIEKRIEGGMGGRERRVTASGKRKWRV